jgi:hypothetical protein
MDHRVQLVSDPNVDQMSTGSLTARELRSPEIGHADVYQERTVVAKTLRRFWGNGLLTSPHSDTLIDVVSRLHRVRPGAGCKPKCLLSQRKFDRMPADFSVDGSSESWGRSSVG